MRSTIGGLRTHRWPTFVASTLASGRCGVCATDRNPHRERDLVECATNANRVSAPALAYRSGHIMFVTVIHHIHDPEGFQAAEAKALEAGLPSQVALPIHAANGDHSLGVC